MDRMTTEPAGLVKYAGITAGDYMRTAVVQIEDQFGEGYAKEHPDLVAAFMNVCARDFQTAVTVGIVQDESERLCDAIRNSSNNSED